MQTRNVPLVNARYWVAILVASVVGANLGDFCSHVLGLGHLRGLPVLAMLFAAILAMERRTRAHSEWFYWAAIVTVRTAATNLGDLGTHDLHLSDPWFVVVLGLLLAALTRAATQRSLQAAEPAQARARLDTTPRYWTAMLIAGTLGTALGDYSADLIGLPASSLGWTVIWAASVTIALRRPASDLPTYWTAIAVVRTAGTNLADWLAGRHGADLGLPASTTLSAVALLAILALWRPAYSPESRPSPS